MKPFSFKQFNINQSEKVFRIGTDAVLLGALAGVFDKQNILEINDLLDNGEFEKLPEFTEMIDYLRKS